MILRITLLVLLALLAACGGQQAVQPPAPPAPTNAPVPTAVPAPTNAPASTDAPAVPTAAEATAVCAAGQRLFTHDRLATEPVCVPEQPERIATLEPASHDLLMALGRPPVAAVGYLDTVLSETYPALSFAANAIADLGFPPNLELLVAAQPDLIITSDTNAEAASYEQLSAIAPTVMLRGGPSGEWKAWLDAAAAALGLEAELGRLFDDYEARLQRFRTTVGDPAALAVSIVRVQPDDQVMLNLVNSFPSVVVADAGLSRPESQALDAAAAQERYGSEIGATISLEQAQLADADVIIVWGAQASADQQAAAEERWQALNANPVWASLAAVQAGDVHRVGSHWVGWGLHAAHAVIDDLFTVVAGADPATVAPNPLRAATASAGQPTGTTTQLPGFPPLDPPIPLFEVVGETADTLTVKHLRGESIIPRNPQRIVTSLGTAEILISLGIMPVGYAAREDLSPVVREVAPDVTYLPVVDSGPNLEQLAALQPDLIIGYSFIGGQNPEDYELINQIAPTVVFNDFPAYNFQDSTQQIAALFDREAEAEAVLSHYNQRVATIRARIAPVIGDETVSPILFFETPWLYSPRQYSVAGLVVPEPNVGWLYHELQLRPGPELARFMGAGTEGFSNAYFEVVGELLPEVQAEHLVVFPGGYSGAEEISEGYEAYTDSPLWQAVPAVQEGNVYEIVGVNRAHGYYSLLDVMERFAEAVTQQP